MLTVLITFIDPLIKRVFKIKWTDFEVLIPFLQKQTTPAVNVQVSTYKITKIQLIKLEGPKIKPK